MNELCESREVVKGKWNVGNFSSKVVYYLSFFYQNDGYNVHNNSKEGSKIQNFLIRPDDSALG